VGGGPKYSLGGFANATFYNGTLADDMADAVGNTSNAPAIDRVTVQPGPARQWRGHHRRHPHGRIREHRGRRGVGVCGQHLWHLGYNEGVGGANGDFFVDVGSFGMTGSAATMTYPA